MMKYPRWLFVFLLTITWSVMPVTPSALQATSVAKPDQFALGWQAYEEGRFADACRIWQRLADEGMVSAQVNLGVMYDSGTGVSEDPTAAVKWYHAAAIRGDRGAQYNIGVMYESFKYLNSFKFHGKLEIGLFLIFSVMQEANAGDIIKAPT